MRKSKTSKSLMDFFRRHRSTCTQCDLPDLPKTGRTSLGEYFSTQSAVWKVKRNVEGRGTVHFNMEALVRPRDKRVVRQRKKAYPRRKPALSDHVLHAIFLYIVEYMRSREPSTCGAAGLLGAFVHFERYLCEREVWGRRKRVFEIGDLSEEVFDRYRRYVRDNVPSASRYGSFLRSFYAWGVANGFCGFSRSVLASIKEMNFLINHSGNVARSRNPIKDALTWEEYAQVDGALRSSQGDMRDRALVWFIAETAVRPEAAVRVRAATLTKTAHPQRWSVVVPRLKIRGSRREPTKTHFISSPLGELLAELRSLQPNKEFLFYWLDDDTPLNYMRKAFWRFSEDAKLVTNRIVDRSGVPTRLRLTPVRLRRTKGTMLAELGADELTIAEQLDDKTGAMAAVYAATSSTIVERLADTLDRHPAWYTILNLFKGSTTPKAISGRPTILGGVPHLAGYERLVELIGTIGWCGYELACELRPPLSCYRCPHFIATNNEAVHYNQLEQLKEEANSSVGFESDIVVSALVEDMAAIITLIAKLRTARGAAPQILPSRNPLRLIKDRDIGTL